MKCDICKKTETGRLIKGNAVCDSCFIKGKYNLPENRAKLPDKDPAEEAPPESVKDQTKKKRD